MLWSINNKYLITSHQVELLDEFSLIKNNAVD